MFKNYILICFCFTFLTLSAQESGDIDVSFGDEGSVEYTLMIDDVLHGVFLYDNYLLPDGKLLAVGNAKSGCSGTSYYNGLIMRFLPDGQLDESFNGQGYKLVSNSGFVKMMPTDDGHFLLLNDYEIYKVDMDGEIDPSFGIDGVASFNVNSIDFTMNSDGDFYVIGRKYSGYLQAITKVNSDGTVDENFGNDGDVEFPNEYLLGDVALNSDEEILIIGREYESNPNTKLLVINLNPDGSYNTAFSEDGIFEYEPDSNSYGNRLYIDENDRIFGFGYGTLNYNESQGLILFRLTSEGNLDTSFNGGGITSFPVISDSSPKTVHVLDNNEMIITGTGYNNMYAVKVGEDGHQDMNFGIDGKILTSDFENSGINVNSIIDGNAIIFLGNSTFADCAQQKYKGVLTKYFYSEDLNTNTFEKTSNFKVFPNPFQNSIQIEISNNLSSKNPKLELFDINGRAVLLNSEIEIQNQTAVLNTSGLSSGTYFIKLSYGNQEKVVKQIVKR